MDKLVHLEHDGVDFGDAPVALELHLGERILELRAHLVALGKALSELLDLLRERLLRLDRRLHRLGRGVHAPEALPPHEIASLLVLHQRLGELAAGELVERLELGRRVLGEAFEFVLFLLGQHAEVGQRFTNLLYVLDGVCRNRLARSIH